MADSERYKIRELEEKFYNVKMNYYRFVIRNDDRDILSRFSKIPDSWDNYNPAGGVRLSEELKSRLSDIKKKKTWELKLESLYLFYITDIENKLVSVFQQRDIDSTELDETIDSVNSLMLEIDGDLLNFKYLMLTLAKRSVSDFYYLLSSYSRFFHKKNLTYESDVKELLNEFIVILKKHKNVDNSVDRFIKYEQDISPLFPKSSNQLGWRMNEFAVKEYLDSRNQIMAIGELNRVVREGFEYKKILMSYYSFLKYYFNENDGKLFRLNFISDSLKVKLDEGRISPGLFESHEEIRRSFSDYKAHFENSGIIGFGPAGISYLDLLDFIYRACKIIEFYYLRNMKYDTLQNFRTEVLFYIEKELFALKS